MKGAVPLFIGVVAISFVIVALGSSVQLSSFDSPRGQLSLIDTYMGNGEGNCDCVGNSEPFPKIKRKQPDCNNPDIGTVTYSSQGNVGSVDKENCQIALQPFPTGEICHLIIGTAGWELDKASAAKKECKSKTRELEKECQAQEDAVDDLAECLANPKDESCKDDREQIKKIFDPMKEKCKECKKKTASDPKLSCVAKSKKNEYGSTYKDECRLVTPDAQWNDYTLGSLSSYVEVGHTNTHINCRTDPPTSTMTLGQLYCKGTCEEK